MSKKRPNIIIFNPDEMRWDAMGHMGNEAAYTPNLDRFAREDAVSFDHAYCQNPVCVPSRCSFTTGLYPHVNGHRTMQHLMHDHETSLFKELKEAGYYVWMNARNDLVAGQIEGLAESHADEIYYYDTTKPPVQLGPAALAAMAKKDNPYPYSHFMGVTPRETGSDSADTRAAIRRLEEPWGDQPICLFLGLNNPHPPYAVEQRYYDQIDKSKLPRRVRAEETENKSRILSEIRKNSGLDDWTEEQWQEMQTVYLAQCAMIDDLFGQLIDALKRTGQYDNSAIFFLSDHGDFAGHYGLPEKAQNTFEDCLTRVPLLIKPPKGEAVDPGIAAGITELTDFYASVMDYAGVEPNHDHFGRSLRPVVADRSAKIRRFACSEGGRRAEEIQCDEFHAAGPEGTGKNVEYWARMTAQCDAEAHEKGSMITDGHFKYVERLSGKNELYDLEADPLEMKNIYGQAGTEDVTTEMKQALLHWYQETCDIVPREYDSRFTGERLWAIVRNFCPAEYEEQMRDYIRTEHNPHKCIQYAFGLQMKRGKQ